MLVVSLFGLLAFTISAKQPRHSPGRASLADPMRRHGLQMRDKYSSADLKRVLHGVAGQVLLERWLSNRYGWSREQARQIAVVVGGHHGVPPTTFEILTAESHAGLLGIRDSQLAWQAVQHELLDRAAELHGVSERLPYWTGLALPQPVQILLTALVIVSDWIASDESLFPYDFETYLNSSRVATPGSIWTCLAHGTRSSASSLLRSFSSAAFRYRLGRASVRCNLPRSS